ncbi:MAG: T9SS type A sorting domain-containing protein, partial [Bacteroidota bacterium]
NFGTDGATAGEKTYYWDDVEFIGGSGGPMLEQVDMPITFEDTATVDYALVDFGGNASSIVTDPTDPDNLVAQVIKTDMAETWAGTTAGDNGLATAMAFSNEETHVSLSVWSPDAGIPVRLKVEDATNGDISVETEMMTTKAGEWEILQFDFNNHVDGTAALDLSNTYDKLSIFFNFGTDGATAGEKTYYFDDMIFGFVTSVDNVQASDAGIKVTPNPSKTYFQIEFPEALNDDVQMRLFDLSGKLVKQAVLSDQVTSISTGDLLSGMYILRMVQEDKTYFQKIMVTK